MELPPNQGRWPLPAEEEPLGYLAVQAAEREAQYITSSVVSEDSPQLVLLGLEVNMKVTESRTKIDASREKLQELEGDRWGVANIDKLREGTGASIERVLSEIEDMPPLFKYWRAKSEAEQDEQRTWARWLGKDATDEQVLNFIQWYNDRLRKYNQDPEIRSEVEARRERYIKGAEDLYETGYLHPEGREMKLAMLKHLNIYAGDPLVLAIEGIRGRASQSKLYTLMYPELLTSLGTKTFEHELSHFVVHDDELWVDELAADYVAGAVRCGSANVVDALGNVREDKNNGYTAAGLLLEFAIQDRPDAAKAFLRYASAPSYLKEACRKELNDTFLSSDSYDFIDSLTGGMRAAIAVAASTQGAKAAIIQNLLPEGQLTLLQ